ncbi:replication protein [Paenibacillus thiaminolyticus]|uniref:replication protein n=1 Tax=Paenibacillus thiaminolyticus TaxID=49283 RepID=UPI001162B62F|nr:replication protein [Paenibacillus thiaminolyticus]
MASPQLESGYIRIANEIWDEVIRRDFSKRQKDILFFIWRLSYGCQKRAAYIPQMKHFELCGVSRTKVKDELIYLEKCRVLIWDQVNKLFEINKDYENWYISLVKTWDEHEFEELISMNLSQKKFPKREPGIPEKGTLDEEDDEEQFPKRESTVPETGIDSSQKGNPEFPKRELKVPKKGTVTTDEPNNDAASEASKDSKDNKDNIKNNKDTTTSGRGSDELGLDDLIFEPDKKFATAYQVIEKHFGLITNALQIDKLDRYLEAGMDPGLIESAAILSRENGKDIRYMWGVLDNCVQSGIMTIAAWNEDQARRRTAPAKGGYNRNQKPALPIVERVEQPANLSPEEIEEARKLAARLDGGS